MPVCRDMTELIGKTPLISLDRFAAAQGLSGPRLLGKLERQNPGGSAKDRPALRMLRAAEAEGSLRPGGLVIEPTSGNTGVALAACCAALGYRCCIVMPENMSEERKKLIAAFGAELILSPAQEGMAGAVARAESLCRENPGSIVAGQFKNPQNALAHYDTTGPELWEDTEGQLDVLVAGVGTGGTLTGCARFLREKNAGIRIVAAEPERSPLLSEGRTGPHGIQGIGPNFLPEVLDRSLIDRVLTVPDEAAFDMMRTLARTEGLLCGISSGAALYAAVTLAREEDCSGRTLAVILPDTGERYLSVL